MEPGLSLFMSLQRMLPLFKHALKSSSEGSSGRCNVSNILLSQAATSDRRAPVITITEFRACLFVQEII